MGRLPNAMGRAPPQKTGILTGKIRSLEGQSCGQDDRGGDSRARLVRGRHECPRCGRSLRVAATPVPDGTWVTPPNRRCTACSCTGLVVIIERTGRAVHPASQAGKILTQANARQRGGDRIELASNLTRCVRLGVECLEMARSAGTEREDDAADRPAGGATGDRPLKRSTSVKLRPSKANRPRAATAVEKGDTRRMVGMGLA